MNSKPNQAPDSGRRSLFRTGPLLGGLAFLILATLAIFYGPNLLGKTDSVSELPTFAARRGPLLISVTESGTIQAKEREVIKSELEGQTTIIYLIEEGTKVEAGTLLVELDASDLKDREIEQESSRQNAEAAFITATEELAVTESQAQSDVAVATLDDRFAKEDLKKYIEGEYPRELKEAQSKITLAQEELENASETLRWSERLYEEKYLSQTELERDRLARNRAGLEYELAVSALELLEQYTHARKLDELNSAIDQSAMALERVKRKAGADVIQAQAELRARESDFSRQKEKLRRIQDQIAKAVMRAPAAGMVIYATTGKSNRRGNEEPLYEGKSVREREEIIFLPTTDSKRADVKLHESILDKVGLGQRVQITMDALPDKVFEGRVAKIAPLPDGQSAWMNPDLTVYPTEIDLFGDLAEIRTGMTCRAEVIIAQLVDVIYVPVQSVIRIGGQTVVYVIEHGQPVERKIEIGLDNNHMVQVSSGLDEGELVLLAPPLNDAGTRATRDLIERVERPEMPSDRSLSAPADPTATDSREPGGQKPSGMRGKGEGFPGGKPPEGWKGERGGGRPGGRRSGGNRPEGARPERGGRPDGGTKPTEGQSPAGSGN